MKFGTPEMLWMLVLLVGPLIAFLWWAWRVRQRLITQFISSRLVNQLKVGVSPVRQKARLAMMVAAVVFIVLALARPQWGMSQEEARQRGLDIIVAIDTSKSMLAQDVQPNRLARAKLAALDLLRRAKTDRLGVVAFAGSAFLDCPLTLDDGAFAQSVNALDTKTISDGGTAIGDAIDLADETFKHESDDHKVLVLFTDGEDHDSDAVDAARKAAKDGMVIFTIGIGSAEGELLRITDERGQTDYIRDGQGQPVKSKLDEDLLQQIATATKGFYLPLRGAKTMDTLYEKGIEPLPKSEKSSRIFQYYNDRFYWPLSIAILILIWEMFFPDRQRRRKKSLVPPVIPTIETVAVLFLLLLPLGARASSGSALREYDEGNFKDALQDYNKLLEKKQDDPRLHFNTGAAAYQSKQLEQATNEFNAALMSPDLKLQEHAYYNLGNTLYRMGQQETDADKKKAVWENAIRNYESAAKLNAQDEDAKFNQQFVKRQLEELKKQQQQQQQKNSDKNQKQNQNKKDDQNQQKNQQGQQNKKDQQNQQDKKDQQKDGQQDKDQNQDSKTDKVKQKSDEQKKKEEQEAKERQQQQQQDQQKPDDQKNAQGQMGDQQEKNEEAKRDAETMAAGQMTPTQAKQLLDAQKDKERVFQLAPPNKGRSASRPVKDW